MPTVPMMLTRFVPAGSGVVGSHGASGAAAGAAGAGASTDWPKSLRSPPPLADPNEPDLGRAEGDDGDCAWQPLKATALAKRRVVAAK